MLCAKLGYGNITLRRKIAERKLKRFIQTGLYGLLCDVRPVVGYTDMTYHSLPFCLKHGFVESCSVVRFRKERRIMKLINIYVIGLQIFKACFEISLQGVCVKGACFVAITILLRTSERAYPIFSSLSE